MKITIYDGATTIGGNKIYLEEEGRGIFLDFGMNFAKYGQYFAEYLSERVTRGIYDLLHLNLIPRLNIYRQDLIPHDVDISTFPKLDVEAVLLSHPHLDHFGNIGILNANIPIVTSPTAIALIKAMRDSTRAGFGSEAAYFSPRVSEADPRITKSDSRKTGYYGRNCYLTEKPGERLSEFLCSLPGGKVLNSGEICHVDEKDLHFNIKAFPVDHSIYGANAYLIYGNTTIAYTGDFRLHGKHADSSRKFVKAGEASILIIEGTRTGREHDFPESEQTVYENCLKAVEETDRLVIADFSARNFERLETFMDIAENTGRQLVVTARDAYMLHTLECCDGACRMKNLGIYGELKARRDKWETEIVEERWGDRYLDPADISRNPENYILCFSFFDLKHLLDIKPEGGSYIYSSSEAISEEQEFDFRRLYNWLDFFNLKTHGFRMVEKEGDLKPEFVRGYHASGHASKEDLIWAIENMDPDVIIPVHTTNSEWFKEHFENVVILENGETYEI